MAYRKRGGNMLKRAFALSDKGAKDLKKELRPPHYIIYV